MKSKLIVLSILFLFSGVTAEAQFFKKLKEKAGKVLSGESDSKNTNDDAMLKKMMGEPEPAPEDNNVILPENYFFSYHATMQLKNSQGTTEIEYYLEPEESYYAKKQTNDSFTEYVVYDNQRNMEVYYIEIKEEKKRAHKKMDIFTKAKMVGAYRDAPNRKVKLIEDKTLLGYACKGYEISTDAGITQLWVTNETPATMYGAFFEKRAEVPDSPFTKNTMILEMSFTSADEPKKNYHMIYTELQLNTLVFNNNEYKK